jgi:hypothetical protein
MHTFVWWIIVSLSFAQCACSSSLAPRSSSSSEVQLSPSCQSRVASSMTHDLASDDTAIVDRFAKVPAGGLVVYIESLLLVDGRREAVHGDFAGILLEGRVANTTCHEVVFTDVDLRRSLSQITLFEFNGNPEIVLEHSGMFVSRRPPAAFKVAPGQSQSFRVGIDFVPPVAAMVAREWQMNSEYGYRFDPEVLRKRGHLPIAGPPDAKLRATLRLL